MVTKNFRLMVGADLITSGKTTSGTINGFKEAMKKMKAWDGAIYEPRSSSFCLADIMNLKSTITHMNNNTETFIKSGLEGITLMINDDTSEPAADEYFMESIELQSSINTLTIDSISEDYLYLVSKSFTNNTTEDVVIRSVGLVAAIWNSAAILKTYLLFRERLDSSITISPGETCTFSVAIK